MDAGKEKTQESKEVSHEEWSQTSCSVLISLQVSQKKSIYYPQSLLELMSFGIAFNYSQSSQLFFPSVGFAK